MSFQLAPRALTHNHRPVYYRGPQPRPLPQSFVDYQRALDLCAREIAVHEAGHAVVSLALDQPLWRVMIDPKNRSGICWGAPPSAASLESNSRAFADACAKWKAAGVTDGERKVLATEMVILAAGGAAQRQYNPSADAQMWLSDDRKIEAVANMVHHERDRAREFANRQRRRAEALVLRHRSEITAVAATLVEKHEMSGDAVRRIIDSTTIRHRASTM
jgi:ATP-dependent Zn protease